MADPALALAPGLVLHPGHLDRAAQGALLDALRAALAAAPAFTPTMPRTGKPFSVRMSNCGPLGWVSDRAGYRYQPHHPETGAPWPAMPEAAMAAWRALSGCPAPPEACLVNLYAAGARMGLHQDRDEETFAAPVVSLSLGATALFRYGGADRGDPTRSVRLASGDALVMGGPARLAFHGVDRILKGTDALGVGDLGIGDPGAGEGGRVNLTLRRVTPFA
jgi:DNA oxidative demethylase